MMCTVLRTVLQTADLHIWHTFSQTQYNYVNTFQQYYRLTDISEECNTSRLGNYLSVNSITCYKK
jgi:hypothetical protein